MKYSTLSKLSHRGHKRIIKSNPLVAQLNRIKAQLNQIDSTTKLSIPIDWEDFAKLCQIRSGGKMVQFVPYPYQLVLSRLMDLYNNIMVVKSRQLGVTQAIISKFLHRAAVNPAYSSMAFIRNQQDASAIARRARQMLSGLNDYIRPDSDSLSFLKLAKGGEVYFKNSAKEGSRSYDSVSDFLFDEAAFSENVQDIYAASSPSSALAGDRVTKLIVSTPCAKSGWYWDKLSQDNANDDVEEICQSVAAGELFKEIPGVYWWVDTAGVCKLVLHWRCHPVYSQIPNYLSYRQQQDGTDFETINREYNLRFIDSSVSVFSADLIRANATESISKVRQEQATYYIGLDTSTTGNDYCVATVLQEVGGNYSVVELYRKRQQTSEYHLYHLGELIKKYQPRLVGIEVTGGVGQVYLEQLSKQHKSIRFSSIRTTGDSKLVLISNLLLALEKNCLKYPIGSPIIDELLSFRRQGKKLEAARGKHDDCVMSLAFALQITPFNEKKVSLVDFSKVKMWVD